MIPRARQRRARAGWLALVALILVVHIAAIMARIQEYRQVCLGPALVCQGIGQPWRLIPANVISLREAGLSPDAFAALEAAKWVFFSSVWLAIGGLIFARKSDEWFALVVAFFLVTFPTGWDSIPSALARAYPATGLFVAVLQYLVSWGLVLFATLFPNGRLVPRWTRWLLLVSGFLSLWAFLPFVWQQSGWAYLQLVLFMGVLAGLGLAQVVRYRRYSNPGERERTRWVVFGLGASIGLLILLIVAVLVGGVHFGPANGPLDHFAGEIVYQVSIALIPLSVGVAILRNRLFDIDLIIRRTLVYALLTALLALAYFGSVVVLQNIFGVLTGQRQSALVTVLSTLVIAALFVPLRRRVQGVIDRRFYRSKYDAARTLAAFGSELRDETNLDALTGRLVNVVDDALQPEAVALWLKPAVSGGPHAPGPGEPVN